MKNNVMKSILSFIAFLVSVGIYAQSVSGLVTSEDGPLPGATVLVKGTSNGTTTDFDGNFTINAGADDVLVVSFVGFVSQEVSVAGQDNITINLVSDSELEEVIVTGYGSQSQREITSATVNVNAEDFNQGLSSASSNIKEVAKVLQSLKETVAAFETVDMPEGLGDEFQKMKNTVKELNAKYEAMLGAMNK